jgi:hypothetical protein
MATISLRQLYLYDKWPGSVSDVGPPPNGYDSTVEGSGNDVTNALFQPGEKRRILNDGTVNPGWSTMMYLQFVEGSDSAFDADADPSTGYCACFHIVDASEHAPDGQTDYYLVTHDLTNSEGTLGGAVAFAMTDLSGADTTGTGWANYGWFWVGGVNPCVTGPNRVDMTAIGGEMKTGGSVAIGNPVYINGDGTNAAALAHALIDSTKHLHDQVIGRALVTDA